MKIKKISLAVFLSALTSLSYAQEFPGLVEGKDYSKAKISPTVVDANQSKPTFVEFFWYGCPHCYHVKDQSAQLAKKHGAKINYVRYPVGFPNWDVGGKIFFAFEEMKILDKMHDKTFDQIHRHRVNIFADKKGFDALLTTNGVDVKKFNETYNSFSVNAKWGKAKTITESHKITGSPIFAVYSGGYTYQVSPAQAGGYDKALNNIDVILKNKSK